MKTKYSIPNLLSIFCGLTFSLVLVSCDKDEFFVGEVKYETEQSDGTMLVDAWASEYNLEIETDGEWVLESEDRFIHPSHKNGTGNSTVVLYIENNQSEERKVGSLTVIFPKHEELNKTILIEQKWKGDYDDNAADKITTSNKIYAIGYSYDATGEWASPNSVKVEIFDTKTLNEKGKHVIGPTQVSLVANTITGSTISDMTNALALKADVKGGFGKFKAEANASFDMNHAQNSNYEFATTYFNLDVRVASFDLDLQTLCDDYMTDDAWYAINGVPRENKRTHKQKVSYPSTNEGFRDLVKNYGTHVIMSARLGGRVRHSMEIDISKITSSYDVKAFAKASYDGVFASGGGNVDEKFKQSFEDNRKNINIRLNVLGGDELKAKALGSESGFNANNLDEWVKSVTDNNMALVNFDNNSLIPIYELIDESLTLEDDGVDGKARKDALKKYMEGSDIASDFSSYDCGTVVKFAYKGISTMDDFSYVNDIIIDGQYVGQMCLEYIPNIDREHAVTVIYPVINNIPRYNMGFFVGNESHKPARIVWDGTDVSVYEYSDYSEVYWGEMIYLRGASITPVPPEGTDEKQGYVADSFLKLGNIRYPLVKIFNNVWTAKDFQWDRDNAGNPIHNINAYNGINYYSPTVLNENKNIAPVGWRVPTSTDYLDIKNKLEANGISNIGTAFLPNGLLGYNAQFVGWLDGSVFRNGDGYSQAEYLTSDLHHIRIRKDGGFGVEPWGQDGGSNYRMSFRLIKK